MLPTNFLESEINGLGSHARRAYRPMSDAVKTKTSPDAAKLYIFLNFDAQKNISIQNGTYLRKKSQLLRDGQNGHHAPFQLRTLYGGDANRLYGAGGIWLRKDGGGGRRVAGDGGGTGLQEPDDVSGRHPYRTFCRGNERPQGSFRLSYVRRRAARLQGNFPALFYRQGRQAGPLSGALSAVRCHPQGIYGAKLSDGAAISLKKVRKNLRRIKKSLYLQSHSETSGI